MKEQVNPIDISSKTGIMTVEETAQYFGKSTSWVYKNWKVLGGRKLGGSLFFPSKGDLYDAIFPKKEGVEVRLYPEGNPVHSIRIQNKNKSQKGRSRKAKGGGKPSSRESDPNRYGLLDIG